MAATSGDSTKTKQRREKLQLQTQQEVEERKEDGTETTEEEKIVEDKE